MFLTSLPFDYATLVDRGDRVRTTHKPSADSRRRHTSLRGKA